MNPLEDSQFRDTVGWEMARRRSREWRDRIAGCPRVRVMTGEHRGRIGYRTAVYHDPDRERWGVSLAPGLDVYFRTEVFEILQ